MIGISVIGCGHWGHNHVRVFNSLANASVKQIIDPDEARLARVSAQFPEIPAGRDYRTALQNCDIDAAVIATPTSTHYQLAKEALRAGKHVLCEKPLAETSGEAEELHELARQTKRTLMVAHTFLFNNGIVRLKSLYRSGDIGRLQYLAASRTNLGPIRSDVNAAYDLASHDISIFNWLLESEPEEASATGQSFLQPGIEDVVFLSLRYPRGVLASIRASWLDPKKVRQITVVGSHRMVTWDDLEPTSPIAIYNKGALAESLPKGYGEFLRVSMWDGDIVLPKVEQEEPLKAQDSHFLDAISGATPRSTGQFAAGVVRTLEAAAKSLKLGGAPVAVGRAAALSRVRSKKVDEARSPNQSPVGTRVRR
jgi:predicted dehydrogenase